MRIGIVGLAGSGKSTLFDALAGGRGTGGPGPDAVRVATVHAEDDETLRLLAGIWKSRKVTPLSFTLHDFPGLRPRGARLAAVRDQVEGLVLVVRGFSTDAYHYERKRPDPARDAADLAAELILADLDVVTRRVEKLEVSVTKPTPRREEERRELELLARVRDALEDEIPVKDQRLSPEEERTLGGYSLLTLKPWFLLVNLPDEGGEGAAEAVEGPFEARRELRVKLEADLLELEPPDREEFMAELGVEELHLSRLLDDILEAMGIIRFYTASEKEARAWELRRGETAVAAAGRIHSDLARGFIRAEVLAVEDLRAAGSYAAARKAGTYRTEGRDYVVRDGDILNILFSV